ncbi:hypothetical protein MHU86_13369 [Fragilaria crotonensis]|nr:hypothetical protein MHU86_13369 [Fragilaria crotonensis]
MVQVIKRCASIKDVKTIEVFLQCSEPSAFHFYTMIGFRQLNKSEADDGFKMLPLHLQTALKSQTPSSFLRSTNDSKHPMLMHLRHGELNYRNSANAAKDKEDDEDTVNVEPRTQPFWCQYPPPLLIGGGRFVYDRKDADNLFMSLPLLRKLLPGPLEPLLPANSLFLKGEMTLVRRKQHSESEGTQWFSSGEINLMLSILTCDGRYEDATFILSVYFGSVLKKGFAAHASYKALLQLEKDNASMDEKELEALVQKILGTGSKQIKRTQQVQQDFVVHEIIERNPGLLSKQVLVFPQNEDGEHWSVTFVFNPGYIRDNVGDIENADNSPKPFFFRYCSKYPFGTRDVSIDTGIIWFLNLSYSTKVYQESMPAQEANLLPRQDDGWNCGVGVVAAVGIILRNVCTQKVERMNFDEQFGPQKNWELHQDNITKEWFAYFDRRFFEPLPTENNDLILADYLTMLRQEWFVLFDRMAAMQYEVFPKRVNKNNSVNPLYLETKQSTLAWPDFDTMKKRQTLSKPKLRLLRKQIDEEKKKRHQAAAQGDSSAIDVSQSPDRNIIVDLSSPAEKADKAFDLSSPAKRGAGVSMNLDENVTINLMSPDAKASAALRETVDDNEINFMSPETEPSMAAATQVASQSNEIARASADDLTIIDPDTIVAEIRIDHTPTKDDVADIEIEDTPTKKTSRQMKNQDGELLKRLHLDDVLFEDDNVVPQRKKGRLKSDDDDGDVDNDYIVLTEEAKQQKVSTQSTTTIGAFYHKYHATATADDTIVTIDKGFKAELSKFIAESFEKWNWSSEKDHQKTIEFWAKQMKARDCSESKKEYIRELIKGIKNERSQFTKELTNEFMFTRLTMVKGLRFEKANNSFYARLVYQEPSETDPKTMVVSEEELKVDEEWVRSEYADVDIQHIINMHQTDKWTDVPRDVEVRIAKHKVVRVRYVPPKFAM